MGLNIQNHNKKMVSKFFVYKSEIFVNKYCLINNMRKKRVTPCQMRLQKDFEDLKIMPGTELTIPDPNNLQYFIVRITPESGIWKNGNFDFEFTIPDDFPFTRPTVKCLTRIWHPNIEETGAICLNILRDNYTCAIDISMLVAGLQYLFSEPNPHDPLNKEASEEFINNPSHFKMKAKEYMTLYCPK